jgi:hypothetical protein
MTPMEEFARDARSWSRQTIIFTLQYSLSGAESPEEERALVTKVSDQSAEIMNRLWTSAERGSTDLTQALHVFIRLVLEWCSERVRADSV